jgi:hypothetical protein
VQNNGGPKLANMKNLSLANFADIAVNATGLGIHPGEA